MKLKTLITIMFLIMLYSSMGNATPVIYTDSITIANIKITNLENLHIYDLTVDSSVARALASDNPYPSLDNSKTTIKGSVIDFSNSGNAFAISSLDYSTGPNSIFRGSTYSLYSSAIVSDFGYANSVSNFAEILSFQALASTAVTFSLEVFGDDDGMRVAKPNYDWSSAGISYAIGNITQGFSTGLAASLSDAMSISSGILSTTVHFQQGDIGTFSLLASTEIEINRENPTNPVPEPATLLLFGTCIVGLAGTKFRRNRGPSELRVHEK